LLIEWARRVVAACRCSMSRAGFSVMSRYRRQTEAGPVCAAARARRLYGGPCV
jgi:hypothetical protein